jgi:Icc-related predicted phosphoesterase
VQLKWLEGLLAGGKKCFLLMHMPPVIGDWTHAFKDDGDIFAKMVSSNNVQAIFCGHIHAYGEMEHFGIRYIITGGAGSPLYTTFSDTQPIHHYPVVTANESGWSYVVTKVE